MKPEKRYQQIQSELQRKHLLELFYIPAITAAFLAVEFNAGKYVPENFQIVTFLFAFGLLHILASNFLSFIYNLNWVIFPFSPKATPRLLKIIGGLTLVIAVVFALTKN